MMMYINNNELPIKRFDLCLRPVNKIDIIIVTRTCVYTVYFIVCYVELCALRLRLYTLIRVHMCAHTSIYIYLYFDWGFIFL